MVSPPVNSSGAHWSSLGPMTSRPTSPGLLTANVYVTLPSARTTGGVALFTMLIAGWMTRTVALSVADTWCCGNSVPSNDGMPVAVTVFLTKADSLPVGGGVPWDRLSSVEHV